MWGHAFFWAGADSKRCHDTDTLIKYDDDFSGDDPPRVCNVQSVKDHPGHPPCDVHHGGRHAPCHQ